MRTAPIIYDVLFVLQQVNGLAITPDKKYVAVAGVCVRAYVCVASASACVLYIYMCIFVHVYADKAFLIAKFTTCYICTVWRIIGYQHVKMYHVCSTDTNPVSNNQYTIYGKTFRENFRR